MSVRRLALGILALGPLALGIGCAASDDATCSTLDRRLGVAQGESEWTAEARYRRWSSEAGCHARVVVALYAPGGTWEDEALEPAAVVEAEAPVDEIPADGVRAIERGWEIGERWRLVVDRWPSERDRGEVRLTFR